MNNDFNKDDVVSTGLWVLILILTAIPLINIIALLIMAISAENKNIRNYGKASLLLIILPIILYILLIILSMSGAVFFNI